jgi:hypothetical protein
LEKLVYLVWKRAEDSIECFTNAISDELAGSLEELGARGCSLNLADAAATYAEGMRITRMPEPLSGTVSIWLDTALDRAPVDRLLETTCGRFAGYLVLESMPLVNTTHVAPLGERTPGITTVALLERPEAMRYEDWLECWQGRHTRVAIETQSTFFYIQNAIVRAVTEGAHPWSAIVEEGFPAEAPMDPMVFFDAGGSRSKLEENRSRLLASCGKFIDFARLESHPMSSYVLKRTGG